MIFVGRLQRFNFFLRCYPSYRVPTFTLAGLSPAEYTSLCWTHNRASAIYAHGSLTLMATSSSSSSIQRIGLLGSKVVDIHLGPRSFGIVPNCSFSFGSVGLEHGTAILLLLLERILSDKYCHSPQSNSYTL